MFTQILIFTKSNILLVVNNNRLVYLFSNYQQQQYKRLEFGIIAFWFHVLAGLKKTAELGVFLVFHRGLFMHWLSLRAGSSWPQEPQTVECSCGTSVMDSWLESLKATQIRSTPCGSVETERSSPLVGDSHQLEYNCGVILAVSIWRFRYTH